MSRAETREVRRILRAFVPLCGSPLLWKEFDDEAILEHLVSGLVKALNADFVYISVPDTAKGVELACGPEGRVPASSIPAIRTSLPASTAKRPSTIQSSLSGDRVMVLSTPLRLAPTAALIIASKRSGFPTAIDRLILRMAANEATAVMERAEGLAIARHLASLIDLSSNFIGVASLQGAPLFVNPAGLRLAGLASLEEALARNVVDFVEVQDRDRVLYEVWPQVLSEGRWSGPLSVLNARTCKTRPLLAECFRIDSHGGEPVAVGAMSVDIRRWDQAERTASTPRDMARTREVMSALTRVESLSARERQVLDGVVGGRSHKMMAHELGISVRTIEVHRSRMMRRLGVHTLAEAIKLAMTADAVE